MIAKIDIFWVWLGDVLEIALWLGIGTLFCTALFMLAYTFNDFSNNLNNRNIMVTKHGKSSKKIS